MRARSMLCGLLGLALAGCTSDEEGVKVVITNPSSLTSIASLQITAWNQDAAALLTFPAAAGIAPPPSATTLSIAMPATRSGEVYIDVDALDASGQLVATGTTSVTLQANTFVTAPTVILTGVPAPACDAGTCAASSDSGASTDGLPGSVGSEAGNATSRDSALDDGSSRDSAIPQDSASAADASGGSSDSLGDDVGMTGAGGVIASGGVTETGAGAGGSNGGAGGANGAGGLASKGGGIGAAGVVGRGGVLGHGAVIPIAALPE